MDETARRARSCTGRLLAGLALLLTPPGLAGAAGAASGPAKLPVASVHFEQNATDGDVEVVFKAKGRAEGLAKLTVVGPDGRTVIDFAAPDAATLGIREFEFESPEPPDAARVKAAYPEGVYRFSAKTASGKELQGESRLSHTLPATTSFVHPAAKAAGVPTQGLEIAWKAVSGVSGYILELEQDDIDFTLQLNLPESATRFRVPDGILHPGLEYDLGIGTVAADGN